MGKSNEVHAMAQPTNVSFGAHSSSLLAVAGSLSHYDVCLIFHGSTHSAAQQLYYEFAARLSRTMSEIASIEIEVQLCFVDIQQPLLKDFVFQRPTLCVPMFLAHGYHVNSDIPSQLEMNPTGKLVRLTAPLGPDNDAFTAEMIGEHPCGFYEDEKTNVLAVSGSRSAKAKNQYRQLCSLLAQKLHSPVFLAMANSRNLEQDFGSLRPIRLWTYVLTPGQFFDNARAIAASYTAPLLERTLCQEIVVQRIITTL